MRQELIPLKPKQLAITSLPKFTTELPFFYLTKQKATLKLNINFEGVDSAGHPIRWKVIPNRDEEIGAPSIKAHEVWVKLIKPAIDETRWRNGGELPSIIPLGSVRECLRVLGWGIGGWEHERFLQCIRQMCFAACEADFPLLTTETDEAGKPLLRRIKGSFSRMALYAIGSTHVTEEELKSGKFSFDFDLEDTVYIQLHPLEVEIQRNQPQRPTDNEYLFSVSPAARRWYELVAPKIFGVTNNRGSDYCDVRYSWYVERHHTLKRETARNRVVYQMNRLIKDHKAFGYVSKVEYIEVKELGQEVDFIIRYYPGDGARDSTKRIISNRRGRKPRARQQLEFPMPPGEKISLPPAQQKPTSPRAAPPVPKVQPQPESDTLIDDLCKFGVTETKARELVKSHREATQAQILAYPYRDVGKPRKNAAGWLVAAIEGNYTLPALYLEEQEKRQQTLKAKEQQSAIAKCSLCDVNGWRMVKSERHPQGAMKRCCHDPEIESKFPAAL